MTFRKLRIALLVTCVLMAVILMGISLYREFQYDQSALYAPYEANPVYANYYLYGRSAFASTGLAFLLLVPWPERFTLRTLLIATMLVAVVLRFAAWAARK